MSYIVRRKSIFAIALVLCAVPFGLLAEDWQWPAQVSVAGFDITNVRGSVRPDGSGTAIGIIEIPAVGNHRISLARSARGEITGDTSMNAKVADVDLQGNLALSGGGLEGRGTVQSTPKPIQDASIVVDPSGRVTGSGKVALGAISVPAKFTIAGGAFEVTGSAAAQPPVADTPLAAYKFDGSLQLQGEPGGRLGITASGQVQRTGKLTNQVTTFGVSNVPVNASDGRGTASVDGISVTFKFF